MQRTDIDIFYKQPYNPGQKPTFYGIPKPPAAEFAILHSMEQNGEIDGKILKIAEQLWLK